MLDGRNQVAEIHKSIGKTSQDTSKTPKTFDSGYASSSFPSNKSFCEDKSIYLLKNVKSSNDVRLSEYAWQQVLPESIYPLRSNSLISSTCRCDNHLRTYSLTNIAVNKKRSISIYSTKDNNVVKSQEKAASISASDPQDNENGYNADIDEGTSRGQDFLQECEDLQYEYMDGKEDTVMNSKGVLGSNVPVIDLSWIDADEKKSEARITKYKSLNKQVKSQRIEEMNLDEIKMMITYDSDDIDANEEAENKKSCAEYLFDNEYIYLNDNIKNDICNDHITFNAIDDLEKNKASKNSATSNQTYIKLYNSLDYANIHQTLRLEESEGDVYDCEHCCQGKNQRINEELYSYDKPEWSEQSCLRVAENGLIKDINVAFLSPSNLQIKAEENVNSARDMFCALECCCCLFKCIFKTQNNQ